MIFDADEIKKLEYFIETGRRDQFKSEIVDCLEKLERKIDNNFKIQRGQIRDLENQVRRVSS